MLAGRGPEEMPSSQRNAIESRSIFFIKKNFIVSQSPGPQFKTIVYFLDMSPKIS